MEQTSDRLTGLSRQYFTERHLGLPMEVSQVLGLIPRLSAGALHARTAVLRLVDEETGAHDQVYRFDLAQPDTPDAAEDALAALTRQETVPILIPDLREDARFAPHAPTRPISAVSVPLLQNQALIGTLCVFDRIPDRPAVAAVFEDQDVSLLVTLATEAGIAIETSRLFRAAAQRADELAALRDVGQAIARRLELSEVLDAIATGAMRLLGSQHSQILLWDETAQSLRYGSAVGTEAARVRAQSFAGNRGVNATVARTCRPLLVDDYQSSPYALAEFPDVVATITTPVMFGERLLGILHVHTTEPGRRFSPADLRKLEMLATQAAIAIENARLHSATVRRGEQLATLNELTGNLTTVLDLPAVTAAILKAVQVLLPVHGGQLWECRDGKTLTLITTGGVGSIPGQTRVDMGVGLIGLAAAAREVAYSADVRTDPHFVNQIWAAAEGFVSAIALPLVQGDRVTGAMAVLTRAAHTFSGEEIALLRAFAAHAAIALENARLHEAALRRNADLEALLITARSVMSGLDLPTMLERIVDGAAVIAEIPNVKLLLVDREAGVLRLGAFRGTTAGKFPLPLDGSLSGLVVTTGTPVFSPDCARDARNTVAELDRERGILTYFGLPITIRDDVVGVLTFNTFAPHDYSAEEQSCLATFAAQAAIAIENARLYHEARERGARFRALSELSRKVTASLDLQHVFDYAVQAAVDLLNLALARLWVWQESAGCLRVFASAGDADLLQPPRETFPPNEGVLGAVFQSLETVTLADAGQDPRYAEQEWAQRMGVRSVAVVPLRLGDRAVGVLSVGRRSGGGFRADDMELLVAFAQHVAIATENARLFREKERLAVEELLRLRKLSILSEIGSVMQGTMQMDTLLQVVLTGVTYGEGLGFNRAMLLLVDEARQILRGRMGIGPSSGEEAAAVWGALTSAPRPLAEVIAERTARRGDREDSAFDRLARSFRIPLRGVESVLVRTAIEGRPNRITDARHDPRVHPDWEGRLDVDEFACAPLVAKGKVVGVLVVDNKFNGKPITDEDLEFLAAFATQAGLTVENARVYTSLEDANREIQRSHHRLLQQERLAALGEMAAHVVHEIRNPLVAIGGFARRLAQRLQGSEPEGQYAQIIAREVDRLERIVQDVRGLSRESRLTLTETDLHALLQDCLVLFAERITQQRITVRTELAERFPILHLDGLQIKQAILNLVANALEAMPSGGALTLTTQVVGRQTAQPVEAATASSFADAQVPSGRAGADASLDRAADLPEATEWATLGIGDTGGGIPQEIVGDVFNPFFTTKEIGTGLGLTLVRRIARAHRGRVEVRNNPGQGVTFCLWLPVSAP
jgi:GAF domain-containing protein